MDYQKVLRLWTELFCCLDTSISVMINKHMNETVLAALWVSQRIIFLKCYNSVFSQTTKFSLCYITAHLRDPEEQTLRRNCQT